MDRDYVIRRMNSDDQILYCTEPQISKLLLSNKQELWFSQIPNAKVTQAGINRATNNAANHAANNAANHAANRAANRALNNPLCK